MTSSKEVGSDSEEDFHDAADAIASPSSTNKPSQMSTSESASRTRNATTTKEAAKPSHDVATQVPVVEAIEVVNSVTPEEESTPPEHPLKTMQQAFEESILESSLDLKGRAFSEVNAEVRRQKLLNSHRFDESWTTRWKQRPESKYHPLLKLVSQITFGMHLLQQNQAKSDQEVVKILQTHVDEVDNFLEQTAEDFDLAIKDVDKRIQFLQLPMQHIKVFDVMLDEKQYRTQVLDGNDKIERIIDRTARAMNASLLDVQKGRQATRELGKYLNAVQFTWPSEKPDLDAIYIAMRGNEEGWKKCYKDLQTKGNHLGNKLIELGTIIGDMSKMAAIASKRNGPQSRPRSSGQSSTASSTVLRSRFNIDAQSAYMSTPTKDKPLPRAPGLNRTAEPISKPRPMSFHQRFERPREQASKPARATIAERPKTSSGPQDVTDKTKTFNAGRRASGPLSSHPPDTIRPRSAGHDVNGSSKVKAANRASLVRSSTHSDAPRKPTLQSHDQKATNSAKSGTSNRDSFLSNTKDMLEKSSFARRWSIRKKHPGPTLDDYVEKPANRKSALKQPSEVEAQAPRLTTVKEQPGKASVNRASLPATASLPQPPPLPPPEPKSTVSSMKFGSNSFRQSFASSSAEKSESVHTGHSIAGSMKRRTMRIKGFFSRRQEKES